MRDDIFKSDLDSVSDLISAAVNNRIKTLQG